MYMHQGGTWCMYIHGVYGTYTPYMVRTRSYTPLLLIRGHATTAAKPPLLLAAIFWFRNFGSSQFLRKAYFQALTDFRLVWSSQKCRPPPTQRRLCRRCVGGSGIPDISDVSALS